MRCSISFIAFCAMLASAANAAAIPVVETQSVPEGAIATEATFLPPTSTVVAGPSHFLNATELPSRVASSSVPVVTVFACENGTAGTTVVTSVPLSATGVSGNGTLASPSATTIASAKLGTVGFEGVGLFKEDDDDEATVITSLVEATAVLSSPAEAATGTIAATSLPGPLSSAVTVTVGGCPATQTGPVTVSIATLEPVTVIVPSGASLPLTEAPTSTAVPSSPVQAEVTRVQGGDAPIATIFASMI